MLLLSPSKQKLVDCTVHNPCLNFLENCDFSQFRSKMVQFLISQETLLKVLKLYHVISPNYVMRGGSDKTRQKSFAPLPRASHYSDQSACET